MVGILDCCYLQLTAYCISITRLFSPSFSLSLWIFLLMRVAVYVFDQGERCARNCFCHLLNVVRA